jgi:hypothetical protein
MVMASMLLLGVLSKHGMSYPIANPIAIPAPVSGTPRLSGFHKTNHLEMLEIFWIAITL